MIQKLSADDVYFGIYCFQIQQIAPAIIKREILFDVSSFRYIQDEARLSLQKHGSDLKKTVMIFAETRASLLVQMESLTKD